MLYIMGVILGGFHFLDPLGGLGNQAWRGMGNREILGHMQSYSLRDPYGLQYG